MRNTLYYGDNLDIMREHIADESVDLVYLDPPFNSQRDYNVLFKHAKKDENQAQITAFTDTWQWHKRSYQDFFEDPRNAKLFDLMESLYRVLDGCPMMAYLMMMAPRLIELHRVLKPTGSLYLHCDPTASHYLKIMLDVTFGPDRFRNEVVWHRTRSTKGQTKGFGYVHDIVFMYCKSYQLMQLNRQYAPLSDERIRQHYSNIEAETGRRYMLDNFSQVGPGDPRRFGDKVMSPPSGKHWIWSQEHIDQAVAEGRIIITAGGTPRVKRYLDESRGNPVDDIWNDIPPINSQADERMGYPTQKPLALLERIINASSNPGDLVLDPFCGCGTAVVAAEKLGRRWIGIDITFIAVDLMINRLAENFGLKRGEDYDVLGDPKDAYSAHKLFEESPKQFEIWAVGLVAGVPQPDKSGDKGIDGKVYFMDLEGKLQWAVCQVKGGHLTPSVIRDFAHVIEREKAAMGFFVCLDKPTKGMCREAEEIGFFDSPSGRRIPKLQIRTVKELLEGKEFDFPRGYSLKSGGGKKLTREGEQGALGM